MIVRYKFRIKQPLKFKGLLFCSGSLVLLLNLLFFASQAAAWSPAGPWGGVIHDLRNHSAGSTTLVAGTGNGIYRYDGSIPWSSFGQTLGFRALKTAPDPGSNYIYAIVVPSTDLFIFGQNSQSLPPSGTLYSLNTASGVFTSIGLADTDVTAIGITGSGVLLAGTASGKLYRRSGGIFSQVTITTAGIAVRDILSSSGSSEAFMAQGNAGLNTGFVLRSGDGGLNWSTEFSKTGFVCLCLGRDSSGTAIVGTDNGQVWARTSGVWAATQYGSGLPAYPVVGFGSGPGGETFAVLRDHTWYSTTPLSPSGLFTMPATQSGTWTRWNLDVVSTRVKTAVSSGGDLWVAFDEAGIYKVPSGSVSNVPGTPVDEGISAVSLAGVTLDPRTDGRVIAFGGSGAHELVNGSWNPLAFQSVSGASTTEELQWIREKGFLSAAVTESDPGMIWLGGDGTGLFRGEQIYAGSTTYQWTWVFHSTSADLIWDVMPDPFDSSRLWWATDGGIYMSTEQGAGASQVDSSMGNLNIRDIDFELVEPQYRSYLAGTYRTGSCLLASQDGITWTGAMFDDTSVMSVAVASVYSGSSGRALAGPSYGTSAIPIALVENSSWVADTTVGPPNLVSPEFNSISLPLGLDGDGFSDAFAVVGEDVYSSTAGTANGFPGETWTSITGNISTLSVRSIEVDPKDGNHLWAATGEGSAHTLMGTHFNDNSAPYFGFHPDLPPGIKFEGVGSTADTLTLAWLAPGDDGDLPGWADRYELRTSSQPIGDATAYALAATISPPVPHIAHTEELYDVNIASSGSTPVFFGLKAFDESSLPSSIVTTGSLTAVPRQPVNSVQTNISGTQVTLSWLLDQLVGDPYFENYGSIVVERNGTVVATLGPSLQAWTDTTSSTGETVSYRIKALDGAGNSSDVVVLAVIPSGGGGGGSSGGGGCFIATAAYGSVVEPEVEILRRYRDRYLLRHSWGRALIWLYERMSPPLAALITRIDVLRSAARFLLSPVIVLSGSVDSAGPWAMVPAVAGVFELVILPLVLLGISLFAAAFICCNLAGKMGVFLHKRRG